MKNSFFTILAVAFSAFLFASCSTSRGYSSHKKGYGCPNSSGIKTEAPNKSRMA